MTEVTGPALGAYLAGVEDLCPKMRARSAEAPSSALESVRAELQEGDRAAHRNQSVTENHEKEPSHASQVERDIGPMNEQQAEIASCLIPIVLTPYSTSPMKEWARALGNLSTISYMQHLPLL